MGDGQNIILRDHERICLRDEQGRILVNILRSGDVFLVEPDLLRHELAFAAMGRGEGITMRRETLLSRAELLLFAA